MSDSSTSLRSAAAEAVVSSSARPRGRNLQETLIILLSCFAWLTSLRLYILPAVRPVVLHSSRTPIRPRTGAWPEAEPRLRERRGSRHRDSLTCILGGHPGSKRGTPRQGIKHHHQPAAAVWEELPVSGTCQYLSQEAIILAPLGVFY